MFFGSWLGWTNKTARHCNVAGHRRSGSTFAYCYYRCIPHCASKMQGTSIFALRKIMHRTTAPKCISLQCGKLCTAILTPHQPNRVWAFPVNIQCTNFHLPSNIHALVKYSRQCKGPIGLENTHWFYNGFLKLENTPSTRSLFKTLLEQKINCEPSCNHQCTVLVTIPNPLSAGTYKSQRLTSSGDLPTNLNGRKHWP